MPFRNNLSVTFIPGTDTFSLDLPLEYWDRRSNQLFVIPKDFICDGASIPQFLWSILGHPLQTSARRAAVLHDFLYRNGVVGRKAADQMFYDALIEDGFDPDKAQLFYSGVRTGGTSHYKRS
jgi:hypothetical protein